MTSGASIRDAIEACRVIGVDLDSEVFVTTAELTGMTVELEPGARAPELDITDDSARPDRVTLPQMMERSADDHECLDGLKTIRETASTTLGGRTSAISRRCER